ncbi:MAG: PA2169 family four-helix-bundle protein [Chloroflexota bacterium]
MATDRVLRSLNFLHRIVEAGEKGYAVSASNVNNQGLKILLKSYAQQRARYKSEIQSEIQRLGGEVNARNSIRGVLHRGRIDIFAALTIGNKEREGVVLKEILIGEKIALRTYQTILKNDLSAETREMIKRQYDEATKVVEQIQLMRGVKGRQQIIQLFDEEADVELAMQELKNAEVELETVHKISIDESIELYSDIGTTVFETSFSGAVGGGLWGSLIGAIAGFSAGEATAIVEGTGFVVDIWALIAVAGLLAGALIGGILGYAIGIGIAEEDSYLYDQSVIHGKIIVLATAKKPDTVVTSQIMTRVYSTQRMSAQATAD